MTDVSGKCCSTTRRLAASFGIALALLLSAQVAAAHADDEADPGSSPSSGSVSESSSYSSVGPPSDASDSETGSSPDEEGSSSAGNESSASSDAGSSASSGTGPSESSELSRGEAVPDLPGTDNAGDADSAGSDEYAPPAEFEADSPETNGDAPEPPATEWGDQGQSHGADQHATELEREEHVEGNRGPSSEASARESNRESNSEDSGPSHASFPGSATSARPSVQPLDAPQSMVSDDPLAGPGRGSYLSAAVAAIGNIQPTSLLSRLQKSVSLAGLILLNQASLLFGLYNRRADVDSSEPVPSSTGPTLLVTDAAPTTGDMFATLSVAGDTTYPVGGDPSAPLPTVDVNDPLYPYYFFTLRDPDGMFWPLPDTAEEFPEYNASPAKIEFLDPETGVYQEGSAPLQPGLAPGFSDPGPGAGHYVYTNNGAVPVFVYGPTNAIGSGGESPELWSQILQPGESVAISKPTEPFTSANVTVVRPAEEKSIVVETSQRFDVDGSGEIWTYHVLATRITVGEAGTGVPGDTPGWPDDPPYGNPSDPQGPGVGPPTSLSALADRFLNPQTGVFAQIVSYANTALTVIADDGWRSGVRAVASRAVAVFGLVTSVNQTGEGFQDLGSGRVISGTLNIAAGFLGVASYLGVVGIGLGLTAGAPVAAAAIVGGAVAAAAISGVAFLVKTLSPW
ncbi:ICP22 family protein [Gordonia aurantiaca]|uniref:hypothetical protein n=1 Tax=Gordonia sp. B21 TaxID=3151852 RepID=UPI0032648AFF